MAKPEQTEKATPKRRQEARSKGQVAKSQELPGSLIFLAVVLILHGLLGRFLDGLQGSATGVLSRIGTHGDPTFHSVWFLFAQTFLSIGLVLVVLFAVAVGIGILGNIFQFGFLFSFNAIKPNFGKLNPLTGLKSMFSKRTAVNLAKQLLKLAAVFVIIYSTISANLSVFAEVGNSSPMAIVALVGELIYAMAWKFGLLLVVIGLMDYAYEKWQFESNMKMSKQEVKDEHKQAEGSPEAKGAVKRRQREGARRRMMQNVPRATVVVTNPTHYAVALEWDEDKMDAPVVTAKGADLVAKRIRDIATEHKIPIMENPPLARTLYAQVDLDQAVPPNMYAAVAQVIAFVYKLKRKTIA